MVLTDIGVGAGPAMRWAKTFSNHVREEAFSEGRRDILDFLPQILHESDMLETCEENLNYSVQGLLRTFGRHRISERDARAFGRVDGPSGTVRPANKEAIANAIYGGQWGLENLGNTSPGDGWAFRGSGLIQITGLDNIRRLASALLWSGTLEDLARALREDPEMAMGASIMWWEGNIPDELLGSMAKIRKRVNGGVLGLEHCQALAERVREVLA